MLKIQIFLQTANMMSDYIGKWESNINGGFRWKPIKVEHINNL